MPELNHRQERFVFEYLIDMNAAAAARRAGYSPGTRGSHTAALMKNPLVRERISMEMADLFSDLKITAREMLRERARIAFFRPIRMFDKAGEPLPLHEIDEETLSVLTIHNDLRANGKGVMRVRQPDRQKALAALEKAHAHAMEAMQRNLLPYDPERAAELEAEEARLDAAEAAAMQAAAMQDAAMETASMKTEAAMQAPVPPPAVEPAAVPPPEPMQPGVAQAVSAAVPPFVQGAPQRPPQAVPVAPPMPLITRTPVCQPAPMPASPHPAFRPPARQQPPFQPAPLATQVRRTVEAPYVPPWDRKPEVTQLVVA